MAKQHKFPLVITASLTDDGAAVYMRADATWNRALDGAAVIENEQTLEELLRTAERQEREVCDPYSMPVQRAEDGLLPLSAREQIRLQGPTTRLRRPDPVRAQ